MRLTVALNRFLGFFTVLGGFFMVVCTDQSSITDVGQGTNTDTVYVCPGFGSTPADPPIMSSVPCSCLFQLPPTDTFTPVDTNIPVDTTRFMDTGTPVGMVAVQDTFWTSCTSCRQQNTSTRTGAVCNNGETSTSTSNGTCSGNGGVRYWTYQQIMVCDTTACVDRVTTRFVPAPVKITVLSDTTTVVPDIPQDTVITTVDSLPSNYIRFTIDSLGWGPPGMVATLTEILLDVPFTIVSNDSICLGQAYPLFDGSTVAGGGYAKIFAPWSAVFKVQGVPHSLGWWAWEIFFYSSIKQVTVESSTSVGGPWGKLVTKSYTEEVQHGSVAW